MDRGRLSVDFGFLDRKYIDNFDLRFNHTLLFLKLCYLPFMRTWILVFSINVFISSFSFGDAAKSDEDYGNSIKQFLQHYSPVVQSLGGHLRIDSHWDSDTLNAYSERESDQWVISVYGGLFRHPVISVDGFKAMLCHELGHHLGGTPYKADIPWMSTEPQADYYSGTDCLTELWKTENNIKAIEQSKIPTIVNLKCFAAFSTEERSALCIRIALAGFSFVEFNRVEHGYASEVSPTDFAVAAPANTSGPSLNYPRAQCRLDTYFLAALNQKPPPCW